MSRLEGWRRVTQDILSSYYYLFRLAKVNANTRQNEQQLQRLRSLGGILNPTAADNGSVERKRLMATIRLLQPDHDERMRSIEVGQRTLALVN